MAEVPKRVLWAVRQLEVEPNDIILEVGCGDGLALSRISPLLSRGRIVGVDRSDLAIRSAEKRNKDGLKSGKVQLIEADLAELELDDRFTKVFALNVNVFWHRPKKELEVVRELLVADGTLLLMFEPPAIDQIAQISELTRRNLTANGFDVTAEVRADLPTSAGLLIRAAVIP